MMRNYRNGYIEHCRDLADYFCPRRYRWLPSPNQQTKNTPQLNSHIIDSTGVVAARTLSAGMLSGISSPSRPWFKLRVAGYDRDQENIVNRWLSVCEQRLMTIFHESNFYHAIATVYNDLVIFGTAPMIIYEDAEDVVRCYNLAQNEYFLGASDRGNIDTLAREFTLSGSQAQKQFPDGQYTDTLKQIIAMGEKAKDREIIVRHIIEPNVGPSPVPKKFKYREIYYESTASEDQYLKYGGFEECPFIAPRWDVVANEPYGYSVGMDALGDVKQLQQETKRKAQGIDKMTNPPMVADIALRNQPATMLPGGVTYVPGFAGTGKPAFSPAYQINPPLNHLTEDLREIQMRIKTTFFNDLFLMISQLDTVRSATEIDARREEKLVLLGPVLERFQNEAQDPTIERVFNIAYRKGIFPEPPPEIGKLPVEIEYVSMLAQAQRSVATTSIERSFAFAGNLAGQFPTILDNLDADQALVIYTNLMNAPPTMVRPKTQVDAIREQRSQELAAQQEQAQLAELVAGAKTMSETQVGGGQNALQMMTGL
jgi:hypothetical protein